MVGTKDIDDIAEQAIPLVLTRQVDPAILALIANFASEELKGLGPAVSVGLSFNKIDPRVVGFLTEMSSIRFKGINDTTKQLIRLELAKSVVAGEGSVVRARRIQGLLVGEDARARAAMIGRTEVNTAANFARTTAQRQAGVEKRRWLATSGTRTRDTHRRLNGQVRAITDPFEIDGKYAMYPGGFSDPGENINCRCTSLAIVDPIHEDAAEDLLTVFESARKTQAEFDARVLRWEKRITASILRAFKEQEKAVLDRLERAELTS